ncbi:hypothetical protein ACFVZH_32530, partial [Streptomyces sp. NPDC059534]|uniref:hypothetical protein n=1 Tax=Streptomyces sp. NPDC059534 TaxID=3346859 RepID=UPI0036B11EEE
LALIFGTLLSSQGTDASFVLTLSGFPPGFPFVFPTLPDRFPFRFRFGFHIRWPVGCLSPFGVFTTLADFPGGS